MLRKKQDVHPGQSCDSFHTGTAHETIRPHPESFAQMQLLNPKDQMSILDASGGQSLQILKNESRLSLDKKPWLSKEEFGTFRRDGLK